MDKLSKKFLAITSSLAIAFLPQTIFADETNSGSGNTGSGSEGTGSGSGGAS